MLNDFTILLLSMLPLEKWNFITTYYTKIIITKLVFRFSFLTLTSYCTFRCICLITLFSHEVANPAFNCSSSMPAWVTLVISPVSPCGDLAPPVLYSSLHSQRDAGECESDHDSGPQALLCLTWNQVKVLLVATGRFSVAPIIFRIAPCSSLASPIPVAAPPCWIHPCPRAFAPLLTAWKILF